MINRNIIIAVAIVLLTASCGSSPKFELLSYDKTGIDFSNTITETDSFNVMSYEYIYNGAGVGIGDLNNDGLQDIVFAGNQVLSRVYLNEGNFRFRDITSSLNGLTNSQWYSGVTVGDINGDGWTDLYFTSTASNNPNKCKNRLWINQGSQNGSDPSFVEMAEQYGVADTSQSVNAAFLDYDLDGDLDIYVINNTLTHRMNTSYRAKITDGTASNNDHLFRNNGNGTFSNVSKEAGIVFEGFALGLAVGDVNKDGWPDIYVSNDYISNDLLYINQKDGTFRNEIEKYMSYQAKSSMGNDMADINNDGNPDMFTLDMMPENYDRIKQTINGFSYAFMMNDIKFGYQHQFLRNMLQVHNGFIKGQMLPYSEAGQMAGIFKTEWSWSPLFADYDNDGDKDLIISNGYPRDLTDKDWTFYKVKVFGFVSDEAHVIEMAPTLKVPNIAFENKGDLRFERKKGEWIPELPSYSYGAAFADLDNDGDLDYVVNNLNDKAFVFRNNTSEKSENNYFKLKLKGEGKNLQALGAKVEIWHGGQYQYTEHFLSRGYASSVDPVIHFGTGTSAIIDSLKITWPASGKITFITNLPAGKLFEADIKDAIPAMAADNAGREENLAFSRADSLFDYTHLQNEFIDFFYEQTIIPHKFSQIGPVFSAGDLNGDSNPEILAGASNAAPTSAFTFNGKVFEPIVIEGLTGTKNFTESDMSIADFDSDGDNDVIVLAGGYENQTEEDYVHFLYRNNNGKFKRETLPVSPFIGSAIRPIDFDRDGDLDIFIGSRVKKNMFPYASSSWILKNEKGSFVADTAFKFNLGMVTDAVWSDFDGDGWDDLVVTREWNPVAVLKNNSGKSFTPVYSKALEDNSGLWYSVAAGDFDSDGDNDYILGNLGENIRYKASQKYPTSIYVVDLDLDGKIDPVLTSWWNDKDGKPAEYPVHYWDELRSQSEFFTKIANDFKEFSYVSVKDMFEKGGVRDRINFKLEATTFASSILWNDNGSFRLERLPDIVQYAPLRKMIVRDLNGDGFPDVIAAGNDHSWDVATGWFDSNKGLVLMNKGKYGPGFDVLKPSETGLLLNGMVGSLLWIDLQKPILIAGFNRNKAVVYRFNK